MQALISSLMGWFLTPFGLFVLGVIDSSLVFFLPLGIDIVVILASARNPDTFWLYALLAAAGSTLGAAITYWVGYRVGEDGIRRWVGEDRLERVRSRVSGHTATAVAATAIIPPPFPLTAVVLASGAMSLDAWKFFVTLGLVKAVRFGTEAALAARFGEGITAWMETPAFQVVVGLFIAVVVIGTVVSAVKTFRK